MRCKRIAVEKSRSGPDWPAGWGSPLDENEEEILQIILSREMNKAVGISNLLSFDMLDTDQRGRLIMAVYLRYPDELYECLEHSFGSHADYILALKTLPPQAFVTIMARFMAMGLREDYSLIKDLPRYMHKYYLSSSDFLKEFKSARELADLVIYADIFNIERTGVINPLIVSALQLQPVERWVAAIEVLPDEDCLEFIKRLVELHDPIRLPQLLQAIERRGTAL